MLATIDDNGVYHDPHLITSISQNGVQTPIKITSSLVFSANPAQNAEMDSQVQYAMSEDTASYGTAPVAAMSNGQQIIAKTGTTEYAQSAFFVGAIPAQALTVALFTSQQNDCNAEVTTNCQSLNNLGGMQQGGYGGTWPATIWHTYAENMFVPLGVQSFQPAVFTGADVEPGFAGLRVVAKPPAKKKATQAQNPPAARTPTGRRGRGREPEPLPDLQLRPVGGDLRSERPRHRRVTPGRSARLDRTVEDARQGTAPPGDHHEVNWASRERPALAVILGGTGVLLAASVLATLLGFAEKLPCRAGAWNNGTSSSRTPATPTSTRSTTPKACRPGRCPTPGIRWSTRS